MDPKRGGPDDTGEIPGTTPDKRKALMAGIACAQPHPVVLYELSLKDTGIEYVK